MMLKYLTKNIQLLLVYEKEINITKGSIIFVFSILDQWPLMMGKIQKMFCLAMFQYHWINLIQTINSLDPATFKHSLL